MLFSRNVIILRHLIWNEPSKYCWNSLFLKRNHQTRYAERKTLPILLQKWEDKQKKIEEVQLNGILKAQVLLQKLNSAFSCAWD